MGVAETSPSAPRRDDEGAFKTSRRAHPDPLEWAQARGLDARLHLLGCTKLKQYQSCVCDRSRLEHRRCQLKQTPRTLVGLAKKPLQEPSRSSRASGARPAGPLTRPHGTTLATRGKNVPSASISICGILMGTPADAWGLLSGTTIRVP
jgi:hypothetical protein